MTDSLLLIVGGESDPNTQRIVDQAHLRDRPYVFWDTDTQQAAQIAWDFETPKLDLGDGSFQPSAVYLRYNVFDGDATRNYSAFEVIQAFVLAWPQIRILNRKTMTDANNKSLNLRLAKECGLPIPDTIVMGDLTPLSSVPNPETRIIKPLGGGAHTLCVADIHQDIKKLSSLGPQFVQSRLDGENLRVFSIAGQLFCFHLQTTALDYRDDDRVAVHPIDVPPSVVEGTKKLVERIGFDYCALDFRCRDGFSDPIFLEVNSFPMFVRFDDAGQNCLADAILEYLFT